MVIFLLVFAVAAGGVIWLKKNKNTAPQPEKPENMSVIQDNSISLDDFSQTPISQVNVPLPQTINRSVVVSANLSKTEKTEYLANIAEATKNLRENPISYEDWLKLGMYRKAIGDYVGASEAWKENIKINPGGHIAYNNLGDLYHFYLRDFVLAEKYMKDAIRIKPDYLPTYRNLFDLYTLSYAQKKESADDVLLDGIAKNPKAYDLMVLLAGHYKDEGYNVQAREYYQKALALNPPNHSAIEAELNSIQ